MKKESNSGGGARSNYAMLTFSQGHRICIGQGFARAEFACMLAGWIGHIDFQIKDEKLMDMNKMKIACGITVKPTDSLRVSAKVLPGY
jgi:cytochrome P450